MGSKEREESREPLPPSPRQDLGVLRVPNGSMESHFQTLVPCARPGVRLCAKPLVHSISLILPRILRKWDPDFLGEEAEHREGRQPDQGCTARHWKPANPNPSPCSALLQKQNKPKKSIREKEFVPSWEWKNPQRRKVNMNLVFAGKASCQRHSPYSFSQSRPSLPGFSHREPMA